MTEASDEPEPPEEDSTKEPEKQNRPALKISARLWGGIGQNAGQLGVLIALMTLLLTIIGLSIADLVSLPPKRPHEDPGATVTAQEEQYGAPGVAAGPPSQSGNRSASTSVNDQYAVGDCLSDPRDLASTIACNVPHRAEIIGNAGVDCNDESVVAYAGGTSSVDVLSQIVQAELVDGVCVVRVEDDHIAMSLRGIFVSNDGYGIRECSDRISSTFVPCAHDHTGEVVARMPAGSTANIDCEAMATQYLDQDVSKRFRDLIVEEVRTEDARRCVVSIRAEAAWLRTPLRHLGNGAIDTEPI